MCVIPSTLFKQVQFTFPKALHPPILLLKKELGPPSIKHNQF